MSPRKIPQGHTLDVALAYVMADKDSSPTLVEELKKIAAEYKGRERIFDAHADKKRVDAQRAAFAALPTMGPPGNVTLELTRAMVERAQQLLDAGQAEACDALLEFVPEADATEMLDAYFKDDAA